MYIFIYIYISRIIYMSRIIAAFLLILWVVELLSQGFSTV